VIVEDVTTAGTSIHETVPLLRAAADVRLVSLIVSVDRQERGSGTASALSELAETYAMQTLSLLTIDHIVGYLRQHPVDGRQLIDAEIDAAIDAYRQRYGA
jgi:orotate phosphoribosyltransferase